MTTPSPDQPAREPRRLFVYGSLRTGSAHPLAALLARHSRLLGPATLAGRLYHLGDYPGAVAAEGAPRVHGELRELHPAAAERLLERLDEYEGPTFPRRAVRVSLRGETSLAADAYLFAASVAGRPCIEHGDWLRSLRQQRGDAGETDGAGSLARSVELA